MIGLNLACGNHADVAKQHCVLPRVHPSYCRWVNVDQVSLADWPMAPEVLANALEMPFRDQSFDRLYLGHFLEHIEWKELAETGRRILRVMKPDARVTVVGPAYDYAQAQNEPEWLLEAIREDKDRHDRIARGEATKGLLHAWTATSGRTIEAAGRFGLVNVTMLPVTMFAPPYWPNAAPRALWQVALTASVPTPVDRMSR